MRPRCAHRENCPACADHEATIRLTAIGLLLAAIILALYSWNEVKCPRRTADAVQVGDNTIVAGDSNLDTNLVLDLLGHHRRKPCPGSGTRCGGM